LTIGAPRVGILGGTFDPVHEGHLSAARAAWSTLGLDRLLFIPSRQPPHRADRPRASASHRFAMVALAVAGHAGWEACDLELEREGVSYSFDTLAALHASGCDPRQLHFVIGSDAFAEIASWSRYPAVLDAAHFVVIARPGTPIASLEARVPALASRMVPVRSLAAASRPSIACLEVATPEVSSTEIRQHASTGHAGLTAFVPAPVAAHILQHRLYTPSVSAVR
jgi:nicotinate-nucleotide adenylyltransferase